MKVSNWDNLKKFIMIAFLGCIICYQIYNILCNTQLYVHSDMASTVLLAHEQINTRQYFPDGFYYSTGVFTVHLNLLIIPFMLFIKDWLLCRELAVIVQTTIGIACIFLFFKKVIINHTWKYYASLVVILVLMPISYTVTSFGYYESVYYLNFIFELVILISFINLINSEDTLPAAIIYVLAIIITNLNNTKVLLNFVIPVLGTIIIYMFIEFRHNIKQMILDTKWIYTFVGSLLGIGIAFVLFRLICTKVGLISAVAGITFSPVNKIGENFIKCVNSLFELYGASGKNLLISYMGVMHPIKLLYTVISMFIVPWYALKSYKKIENHNIRLMIIFLTISNLITIYMCIFTTASGTTRYLMPVYYNNILLLVLCIGLIKNNLKFKFETWCIVGIFAILVIGAWEIQIRTEDRDEQGVNVAAADLVEIMKDKGVTYAYANFWDAYVCMMLSNGEITTVAFSGKDLQPYYWLTSEKWYNEEDYNGRHCILVKKNTNIDEKYFFYADEIVYYQKYVLLIFDNNIIKDVKENKNDIDSGWKNILSSLRVTGNTYNYNGSICLKNGGEQSGPYVTLKEGIYEVEITGNNLSFGEVKVTAQSGREIIDLKIVEFTDDKIVYMFQIDEKKRNMEFVLKNEHDTIVYIDDIRYRRVQEINALESKLISEWDIALDSLVVTDNAYRYNKSICVKNGGMQCGPYVTLKEGIYEVEITGSNLSFGEVKVTAQSGKETIDLKIKEFNDKKITYIFQIHETKSNVEFIIKNECDTKIYIYGIHYKKCQNKEEIEREFFSEWDIPLDSLGITGDADRENDSVRLKSGGMQCGPYMTLKEGVYEVEIEGDNLTSGEVNVTAQSGKEVIDFQIEKFNDEKIIYTFQISDNKENVEFTLRNMYDTMIHIYSVQYRKVD